MKNASVFFSIMASLSIFVAGAMYLAYGYLPHEDFVPIGLSLTAGAGVIVYLILDRVAEL